jgi:membrane fusion protein (multidrug efflux system)
MLSQEELDSADATLADSEGQIQAAQAQLDQAKLNLSYTQVMSPFAGVAGLPLVRVGNLVGQDGPTLLTTVSQLDPIRVNFPLPEADFMRYRNRIALLGTRDLAWAKAAFAKLTTTGVTDGGEPGVELVLADGSVYPRRGVTVTANRQIDPTTGTIQMQALFPNPGGELRPGGYGHVRIKRPDAGKNTLVVPEKALISIQGSYSVAVVGPENKVSLRPVVVGGSCQGLRMVTSGIAEGEVIVIEGTQKIAEGALVDPKPAPAPARAEVAAPPATSVTPRLDSALTSAATPKN